MTSEDEFYIGWENKAPGKLGTMMRRAVMALLIVSAITACALVVFQHTIGTSVFEWGQVKEFTGILQAAPYPHLLVQRPGTVVEASPFSSYYLVRPFKFGLDPKLTAQFDGKEVSLRGTLIYRDDQTMIETIPDSVRLTDGSHFTETNNHASSPNDLGIQTLVGEIVDSKCYFGVMNPGQFVPHRACAVRCISGGSPPVLVVQQPHGPPECFLLVSADGHPVNQQVLDMVAEPLQITGRVLGQDNLLILRADPANYRRVK